jgi:MFS family permease
MIASRAPASGPVSRSFLIGYFAAQTGAFISFIPLLSLLLPLKAEALAGVDRGVLLSQTAVVGATVAAAANILAGALSDRTRGRFGRRRPWMLGGLIVVLAGLAGLALSATAAQLIGALILFQLGVNAVYAPLCALLADLVPERRRGFVSAFASAALPLANVFTALVVAPLAANAGLAFGVVALGVVVLILPFAATVREPRHEATEARPPLSGAPPGGLSRALSISLSTSLSTSAFRSRAFSVAFLSRFLAEGGVALNTLYLLFLIQTLPAVARPAGWSDVQVFGALVLATTLAAPLGAFIAGVLSDRSGRRQGYAMIAALGMGLSMAALAYGPAWPLPLLCQAVFGGVHGAHSAAANALTVQVLPDRDRPGRDLGMMNLSIALPQAAAPAVAGLLLAGGAPFAAVFLLGGAACTVAAGALLTMPRRVV